MDDRFQLLDLTQSSHPDSYWSPIRRDLAHSLLVWWNLACSCGSATHLPEIYYMGPHMPPRTVKSLQNKVSLF